MEEYEEFNEGAPLVIANSSMLPWKVSCPTAGDSCAQEFDSLKISVDASFLPLTVANASGIVHQKLCTNKRNLVSAIDAKYRSAISASFQTDPFSMLSLQALPNSFGDARCVAVGKSSGTSGLRSMSHFVSFSPMRRFEVYDLQI